MLPKKGVFVIFTIFLVPCVLSAINDGEVPLHKNANISHIIAEHMKMINLKLDPMTPNVELNYKQMLRIKDVLDIFSITNLAENWSTLKSKFTNNCSEDMTQYFNGMNTGRMWAAKSKCLNFAFSNHELFQNTQTKDIKVP